MTKIRNTKKGMAKKTLSISLAVAMLATSNVPVWAAEDLFTDGTVAEFTSEAEAPVVEEKEELVDAQAVDSNYTVDFKDFKKEFQWGGVNSVVKVKVTDNVTEKNVTRDMNFRFIDANGNEVGDYGAAQPFTSVDAEGYASVSLNFAYYHVGQTFRMQVFKDLQEDWITTSPEMTVAKKEISGVATFSNPVEYTGKQITSIPVSAGDQVVFSETLVPNAEVEIQNFTGVSGDTINAKEYSKDVVGAEGNILSPYYTGKVTGTFVIGQKPVDTADDAVTITLPKYKFEYTGFDVTILGHNFTVTNKLTGEEIEGAAQKFTLSGAVAPGSDMAIVDVTAGKFVNFNVGNANANNLAPVTLPEKVEVVKRNLADTDNTAISITTVTQDTLQGSTIAAEALKNNNLVIKDAKTGMPIKVDENLVITFNGKSEIEVEAGKTYTATVKGKDDTCFVNERNVEFTVVAHDLNKAEFVNESNFENKKVQYTGKQVTFGLTAANLTKELGELKIQTPKGEWIPLSKGVDYDVNVQFAENTNVGQGKIIVLGKGGFAGSQKEISFFITPRTVTADNVNVPEKVLFNESYRYASEYGIEPTIVVKGKDVVDELGNAIELTVPASEYKVDFAFDTKNEVDHNVATTIKELSSLNFVAKNNTFTKYTRIANKEITEADIQMEKTEYTYAAKPIVPDYTIVVDGVTLEKGKDYTEVVTHNTNVGEATLTITGRGDYDRTSVSKKFEVVAANTSSLVVTAPTAEYNGKQHVAAGELELKLGDVTDADTADLLSKQFDFHFPTSKLANINAGDAVVTLVPKKDNKNFVGEHEFTFTIAQATLTGGDLKAFDAKGTKIPDIEKEVFDYDGTAHTFASTVYTNTGVKSPMKLTADDYDIIYKDNVAGNKHYGHILVVAKGNYKNATGEYKCADGSVVKNVVLDKAFKITPITLNEKHTTITVENGTYKEGFIVSPEVTVSYKGKELVEGKDYEIVYEDKDSARTEVTNGKTLTLAVKGIGGYKGYMLANWGIDKFDLKDAELIISGTDAEPVVKVMNGAVVVADSNYDLTVADGKVTVTATKDNKHYVGSQTADIKEALAKPETPMIERVEVYGNKATVILSGESDGAIGYDYVIATDRDCIETKDYDKVNKNKLTTDTTFQYVDQGMYYAYCHAWTRDENGKKVFSEWSNAYPFSVSAITPSQPTITKVTQKGSTVTVTYAASKDALGYDVVLGTELATINDERRPVKYEPYVVKNATKTTVTFKNVEKGTYYVGLHAYNRTAEDGKKVFSPWSVAKKITVK